MPKLIQNKEILNHRRAGVLIPLFSIYSKDSFGIGDFRDLKLAVDWVQKTGSSILQLLPMNEMGPVFCPYDSFSSFALEPVYISLLSLPLPKDKSILRQIESLRKCLPLTGDYVDYKVKEEKLHILRQVFLMQREDELRGLSDFKKENAYWLDDFVLFKALKKYYNGLAWYDWADEHKSRDIGALDKFYRQHAEEINFEEWLQWQLNKQFKGVKRYAQEKGILLKGDLPILVSRDSSDVWAHPEFFKLDFASGAPPDMYCSLGQRWGMPTYNWDNIESDGFRYLKEKLRYAENFYDILRIDHVVGLFRIWSIPYNEPPENKGLNGFFDPQKEHLWGPQGRKILKVMQDSCRMLLCAEDLGVIPKVCIDTLRELNIPGNDVQRWVKDWHNRHTFLEAKEYREVSVAMLSTHDTTNWAAWWENEAGTVDGELFMRKCCDHRGIGFNRVKDALFDPLFSRQGRLRWRNEIDSVDKLLGILSSGRGILREHLLDFIDMWENTFKEKDKLWGILGLVGPMREECDAEIFSAILKFILKANSIISINNLFDILYYGGFLKEDSYKYRINTPGTVSKANWSLKSPIPLEGLLKDSFASNIRKLVLESARV
ncbi:MAG: 4-alpha-glucanotransferase [Candidatus Omnitrophota bacterium]